MKLHINLDKDETQAFKNFMGTVKPEEVPVEQFIRHVFFMGIEALKSQLIERVQQYAEEHADELAASGIDVNQLTEEPEVKVEGNVEVIE